MLSFKAALCLVLAGWIHSSAVSLFSGSKHFQLHQQRQFVFRPRRRKKPPEQNSSCSLSQHLHTHNIIISHYWCDGAVYNWCKYMYKNGSCSSSDTLNMALEDTLWQVDAKNVYHWFSHVTYCIFIMYCM